jgi:hypothetical protein
MNSTSCLASPPLSQTAQTSPHIPSQDQVADIQAARARRRLQNKIAQRHHRMIPYTPSLFCRRHPGLTDSPTVTGLRKATQKGLLSQGQDSQPESLMNYQRETEPSSSSPVVPADALSTPPFSQHETFTPHSVDFGLTNRINLDSLSLEDFFSGIDGLEEADVNFLEGQASDIITASTPSLIIHSGDSSGTSPLPLELPNSRRQKTVPQYQNQTNNGQLAIHIASQGGFASIIQVLLENGADLNLIDSHGRTALHYAVEGNHVESVKILLQWGADPLLTDLSGLNSLQRAVAKGYYSVVCLLMDHGVDPNLGAIADMSSSQVVRLIP